MHIRKYVSIFLLSVYLISFTELNQLIKLPVFVNHFFVHKGKDARLTLAEFIDKHYTHEDDNDGDRDEDMKLPFKTHAACSNISFVSFVTESFDELFIAPFGIEKNTYANFQEQFLTSAYLATVWQPPKSC